EDTSAYFPRGETAVVNLLEGQLAFLSRVRDFELAKGGISQKIGSIVQLKMDYNDYHSWSVRTSKDPSKTLRRNSQFKLEEFLELKLESLQCAARSSFRMGAAQILQLSDGQFDGQIPAMDHSRCLLLGAVLRLRLQRRHQRRSGAVACQSECCRGGEG
ncbi:unnamed protein product, partial [Symbiodinium sp. CCMP2456]